MAVTVTVMLAHGLFVSDHKAHFLSGADGPMFLPARAARGIRSPAQAGSPVRLAAFRETSPRPGDEMVEDLTRTEILPLTGDLQPPVSATR
jgi:hypothetical protein